MTFTPQQLHDAGLRVFPCTADKRPAVKGWQNPLPPDQYHNWGEYIGIVVPDHLTVIDLDIYKGVSPGIVDQGLGAPIDWAAAYLQTTKSGGQHYGLRNSDWPVRQGANLLGIEGFDIRAAGKGFICTGPDYIQQGHGVMALACPALLPQLPEATRIHLQPPPAPPPSSRDFPAVTPEHIRQALAHIDPTERDVWLQVAFALKSDGHPFELWDAWSQRCPEKYDADDQRKTWDAAKVDGGVSMGSLIHYAREGGWVSPPGLDARAAFAQTLPAGSITAPYGKNDYENAGIFLDQVHPQGTLLNVDEEWYTYTDSEGWALTNKITIRGQIGAAMNADPGFDATMGRVDAALGMAQAIVNQPMPEADHDLLAFANGVLHVPTGELRPHAPYPFTLGRRPYDYDPDAKCPRWIKFLHEVLENDPQRIAQLQEALGYLLSGDTGRHKIFIFIGPPRCGKGTTCRVIIDLVGPRHCTGGTLTSLPKDATLHSLVDKSVMVIGDAENKIHPSHRDGVVATLKSLSGGDAISFDRKFKSKATAILPTRLFIASNTVPAIFDDSGALGNRMILIHTDFSALGNEDRGLEEALREEMPGIANWALAGSARLAQLDQFTTPDATVEALEEIKEGFSPMLTFIKECCDFAPAARTSTSDLHKRWDAWRVAEEGQARGLSRSAFTRALKSALQGTPARIKVMWVDGKSTRGVEGLRLKPAADGPGAVVPFPSA